MASSGQILDSPSSSGAKVSSSTPDYYMFGASVEVVSSAAVTHAQCMSRATPSITGESVDSLPARDNSPVDQIGQTVCHCLLDWRMLSNLSVIVIRAWRLQNRLLTQCTLWNPKCYTHICLQRWNGRRQSSSPLRFFTSQVNFERKDTPVFFDCGSSHR